MNMGVDYLSKSRIIPLATLGIFLIAFYKESIAKGQITTFENFPEGSLGASFVDPTSGITFTNGVNNLGPGSFVVDYGGATYPPILPGKIMNIGFRGPGDQFVLGAGPDFTFILPTPSTTVQLDQIYGIFDSASSISVVGYATNGQQVLNTNISFPKHSPPRSMDGSFRMRIYYADEQSGRDYTELCCCWI